MLILILETKKGRQKQKVSSKIFAIPVTLSTVACTEAHADMLKITSNWVLPDFCRNYCHSGTVHIHWFQTPFCSCNIWRGWLDSSHWFHVSIGLKNWSLQSSQRHNTWTGIVNRNWLVPSNDGPLLPGVKVVLNICFVLFWVFSYLNGNKVDGYGNGISCIYSFVLLLYCSLEWFFDPAVNLFAKGIRLV